MDNLESAKEFLAENYGDPDMEELAREDIEQTQKSIK